MADLKTTELDAVTSLNDADLLYAITDVATTPLSKKITVANVKTSLNAGDVKTDQTTPQSIGDTTNRLTKLWALDITVSNAIAGSITGTAAKATNLVGGNNTTLLGSIPYQSNTDTTTLLAPNTTTTKKFLRETGDGTNGTAPAWDTLVDGDLPATIKGLTLAPQTVGFTIAGGTTSKTLTVALDASVSGTNTGDGTYGIASTNYVKIDAADVADNDYAKFTANGLEGRSYAEVLSDIGAAPATAPTFATSITGSYLTASEILITDADKKIVSAPVATYPSLTELSYVKGLSSAAQTQITAKAPSASPTFTGTITLSDNARVDLTLPTADTYCTGNTTDSFASGYSSAIGDLVFFGSSGKWLESDSDAVATCNGLMGIALEAKTDTQAMKVALPGSFVRLDAWNWTVGATLYAGETLGAMQEAIPTGADAIIKVVGFAVSADVIFFNPSPDQQSTVA